MVANSAGAFDWVPRACVWHAAVSGWMWLVDGKGDSGGGKGGYFPGYGIAGNRGLLKQ